MLKDGTEVVKESFVNTVYPSEIYQSMRHFIPDLNKALSQLKRKPYSSQLKFISQSILNAITITLTQKPNRLVS